MGFALPQGTAGTSLAAAGCAIDETAPVSRRAWDQLSAREVYDDIHALIHRMDRDQKWPVSYGPGQSFTATFIKLASEPPKHDHATLARAASKERATRCLGPRMGRWR